MTTPRLHLAFLAAALGWVPLVQGQSPIPAFPGAEGFGMFTIGGRGGDVYIITTLADYDETETPIAGSLRYAIEQEGPRTVVFAVAGYIELKRTLEIRQPYLTLAAQTAPGDGVTLKNYGVEVYAPQVILRHLRVRPGDVAHTEQDAINVRSRDVIIDHCSVSWSTDETLSVIGEATNVTVQWCLIAESLNESVHHKGAHGYGSLLTSPGDVTIHHSIYAFHHSRNPRPKDLLLDFRNNLIYGFGDRAGYNIHEFTRMNYVGNTIRPLSYSQHRDYAFTLGGTNGRIFADGNVWQDEARTVDDDWQLFMPPDGLSRQDVENTVRVNLPFAVPSVTTEAADIALQRMMHETGATFPARDAVDQRILGLIEAGEGQIINSQNNVGGWPDLRAAASPTDNDADGMADTWETQHGLNPNDPTDHRADLDGDGYTNLEEYLNATDPTTPFLWLAPPTLSPPAGTAFTDSLTVTITHNDPETPIRYTLNGDEPTVYHPLYHAPLRLTATRHLRAKALHGQTPTTAAVATYKKLAWQAAEAPPPDVAAGLRAAYYESPDWDEGPPPTARTPLHTTVAPHVSADLRQREYGYALVFEGYLQVPEDGIYTFTFQDDARSRFFLNGTLVTPGTLPDGQTSSAALRAGFHRFELWHLREVPLRYPLVLHWAGPGFASQPIPASAFFHRPSAP